MGILLDMEIARERRRSDFAVRTRPLYVRVKADLPVVLLDMDTGEDVVGHTVNVSLGGLYIEAEHQLPVGTRCLLCLEVGPDEAPREGYATGTVTNIFGDGMGIHFNRLSAEAFQILSWIIEGSGCYALEPLKAMAA